MKTIRNDYCIRMYVASDTLRPALNNLQNNNGFIYGTDAHCLAKVSESNCVKGYEHHGNYPDAESVLKNHKGQEEKTFKVDDLFSELMKIEVCFKPVKIECPDCDGMGEKECDCCGYENDCRKCVGEGEIDGPELELSGENNCTLFNRKYKLRYIDRILTTAIILGVEEIEISNSTGSAVFTVGDFTILLMNVQS